MKRSQIILCLLSCLVFSVTNSTTLSLEEEVSSTSEQNQSFYLPIITTGLPPVIPSTTEVLTEQTTQHLDSISQDGSVLTFSQETNELNEVDIGDVIVSDASELAPQGFLRQVVEIENENGNVVVNTVPATLEDAIEQGELQISGVIHPNGSEEGELADGVRILSAPPSTMSVTGFDYTYFEIEDVVLYDADNNANTTSDQIIANGSIAIRPEYDLDLKIRQRKLDYFIFSTSVHEVAEIEIESNIVSHNIEREKELYRHYLPPIHAQIGFIPVLFTPVLTINIGIDGSIHVGVTSGITQEATLSTGIMYENNNWSKNGNFENNFNFNPPSLSAGLDVKAYAGARIALLLYGTVGPYADVNLFLELEADIYQTPWWTLYGGLEVPMGVDIELFGKNIANYEIVAIVKRKTLAQAAINNDKFVNGYTVPSIDSNAINLQVCADNLAGETVYLQMWRDAAEGYGARTWNESQVASGTCVTFNDLDGTGETFANVDYYTVAAIEPIAGGEAAQMRTACYNDTGEARLCDKINRGESNGASLFVNGYSSPSIDTNAVNLQVCADNLVGKTVYVQMWRDSAEGNPPRTWNESQVAFSTCVTFNDLDSAGDTFANVDYYTVAAIEPIANGEAAQMRTACYNDTGGARLCDKVRQGGSSGSNLLVNGFSSPSIDINTVNLQVCADNLAGRHVYVQMWRDATNGYSERTWNYVLTANDTCITFSDLDGAGDTFANVDYYTVAAIEPIGPTEAAQKRTACYTDTGGTRLCDRVRR